jgi:hypothetical protein
MTVQDRYFWFPEFLILLIAFRAVQLLFERKSRSAAQQLAVIAIVVLSFVVLPLRLLRGHFRRDAALYTTVQRLKASGKLHEPFASCDNWAQSAYLAYLAHEPYDGVVVPERDADEIAHDLNPDFKASPGPLPTTASVHQMLSAAHIKDVLLWPDCPVDAASLGSVLAHSGDATLIRVNASP